MRRSSTLLLALACLAAAAAPVAATQPTRVALELPPPEFLVFPAGTACDFDIHLDVPLNREYMTTFTDRAGNVTREIVTGSLVIRIVNDETGAWAELNVGGPGIYVHRDGSIAEAFLGHGLPIFDAIFYGSIGRHVFWLDENYQLVATGTTAGRSFDICALVA
jgi:hypothetical protein